MAGAGEAHSLAVAADALLVEHVHIHFIEDKHILGLYGGIPNHGLIFFLGAAVLQRGSFRTIWQNFQSLQNQLKDLLHILFPE